MSESLVHPWFASTTDRSITSHNGSAQRSSQKGTVSAFRRAHEAGYRWFQVDVIPIRGDLISRHSLIGRSRRLGRLDRAQVAELLPDVPTLYELLTDPHLAGSRWNIELKSRAGLPVLLSVLQRLKDEGWDLAGLLVSSPIRPSVLRAVALRFPQVALAAPVIHGGVFGVRFLGRRRARTAKGRYDCQQCFHWFLRARPREDPTRPLRQAWTVADRAALDRAMRRGAHPIVDSEVLNIRRDLPDDIELPARTARDVAQDVAAQLYGAPEALALGGGGWRGAFGGIGAIMYLTHRRLFDGIHDLVGISGGSFAVAALSAQPAPPRVGRRRRAAGPPPDAAAGSERGADQDDPEPHVAVLRRLLEGLEGAGRQTRSIVGIVATVVAVALAAVTLSVLPGATIGSTPFSSLWAVPIVLVSSFAVRAVATPRWKWILHGLYHTDVMATIEAGPADPRRPPPRRYAIGATGLADGRLYSFTSDAHNDAARWRKDQNLAIPLGGHRVADIVARATSLPGLGQLGVGRLWLPTCDHPGRPHHRDLCDSIPDRLVDGGVSGIFGRGLIMARARGLRTDRPTRVVVVDAGRRLPPEPRTAMGRVSRLGQRSSALVLLCRWLMVAMDVAYREELKSVRDDNVVNDHQFKLVRLAEEEDTFNPLTGTVPNASRTSVKRRDDLNRLWVLRDQVHRFSLMRVNRANANRTIVVAVAACALEFENEPDVAATLRAVGARLGRPEELVQVWEEVLVPRLGVPVRVLPAEPAEPAAGGGSEPVELGPPQVGGVEPPDQPPALPEMAFDGG